MPDETNQKLGFPMKAIYKVAQKFTIFHIFEIVQQQGLNFYFNYEEAVFLQSTNKHWHAKTFPGINFEYSVSFFPAEYEYESHFYHHVQIFRNFMTKT